MALTAFRSKAVVLLLFICYRLLLPLWNSVIVLCFVVRYFVSILVLQIARWGIENWLLCFVFLVSLDCFVALTHDATGLSAVCDWGISWSYSLFLLIIYKREATDLFNKSYGDVANVKRSKMQLKVW